MTVGFYLMSEKGLRVLETITGEYGTDHIAYVLGARDTNVKNDYFDDIMKLCKEKRIPFVEKNEFNPITANYAFAVSWRWLIKDIPNLIVLHDSLLPKYRGFTPLPTALIKGDTVFGVTALWATDDFDKGDIIGQRSITISYPIKIHNLIELLSHEYCELVSCLYRTLLSSGHLKARKQNELKATYSLWRDEDDYRIEWGADAAYVKRFIDSLGYPYKGASSFLDGRKVRIYDAEVEPPIQIENRQSGKVLFIRSGLPIVVCGDGLLRVMELRDDESELSLLPLRKLRSRFT
jgi:methionyl-tRNA formyltransferase